jgi:hypothetical protein
MTSNREVLARGEVSRLASSRSSFARQDCGPASRDLRRSSSPTFRRLSGSSGRDGTLRRPCVSRATPTRQYDLAGSRSRDRRRLAERGWSRRADLGTAHSRSRTVRTHAWHGGFRDTQAMLAGSQGHSRNFSPSRPRSARHDKSAARRRCRCCHNRALMPRRTKDGPGA